MHDKYWLSKGSHTTGEDGRCALEWVSFLAGEKHSDSPQCVSLVLARFCIVFNDRLPDAERQKLRPYLARTIGTRGDGMDERRLQMCCEWLLHYALPLHLDVAGKQEAARKLRELPADLTIEATQRAIWFARDEASYARTAACERLVVKVRAELEKRGANVTAADAAEAAVAAEAADTAIAAATTAAATADAATAAATAAATDAAEAAVAGAATAVAAVAAEAADTAIAAATAAAATGAKSYWAAREAVYGAIRTRADKLVREQNRVLIPGAFDLLDRMLPTEIIQLPVVSEWREVCEVA